MKRKILLGGLLFLCLTLILNTGVIFATDNPSTNSNNIPVNSNLQITNSPGQTTGNSNQTINNSSQQQTNNSTSNQLKTYATTTSEGAAGSEAAGATKTIKVLIYNGNYASVNCVNGLERALDYANTNNVIPGVIFSYVTSTIINSAILTGYNLLAMPGGDGGSLYLNSGSISGTAIKNFVYNGGGYLGICAGAYAAAAHTDGYYDGWGIAPHVYCKEVSYEGGLTIQITSSGQQVFGSGGTRTLAHYNGPAMYISGNAVVFATYADDSTGYKGYDAIVGDYYGKGRVVLSGPHPELSPLIPTFVSQLINWATSSQSSSVNVTVSQVAAAADSVKTFYENNKRLPNYVTISNQQITMPQFLNLMATATIQANSGSTVTIPIKNVNSPTNSTGSFTSGNIQKTEFLSIAQSIKTFIDTNGRAPNYVTTSLGKISFNTLVYMYSKIMSFYYTNKRLPSYIAMKP